MGEYDRNGNVNNKASKQSSKSILSLLEQHENANHINAYRKKVSSPIKVTTSIQLEKLLAEILKNHTSKNRRSSEDDDGLTDEIKSLAEAERTVRQDLENARLTSFRQTFPTQTQDSKPYCWTSPTSSESSPSTSTQRHCLDRQEMYKLPQDEDCSSHILFEQYECSSSLSSTINRSCLSSCYDIKKTFYSNEKISNIRLNAQVPRKISMKRREYRRERSRKGRKSKPPTIKPCETSYLQNHDISVNKNVEASINASRHKEEFRTRRYNARHTPMRSVRGKPQKQYRTNVKMTPSTARRTRIRSQQNIFDETSRSLKILIEEKWSGLKETISLLAIVAFGRHEYKTLPFSFLQRSQQRKTTLNSHCNRTYQGGISVFASSLVLVTSLHEHLDEQVFWVSLCAVPSFLTYVEIKSPHHKDEMNIAFTILLIKFFVDLLKGSKKENEK